MPEGWAVGIGEEPSTFRLGVEHPQALQSMPFNAHHIKGITLKHKELKAEVLPFVESRK